MKTITKILFGALMLACSAGAYAEDKYDQLSKELIEAGASVQGKKIAIIPFSYADGRAGVSKDGSVISERLTIKMINSHKFEIIERSVLDKVMAELKLQASGTIDASSAQQLGKVLGVEAIITGTLVEMQAGEIEVNARLIKTETAQAIGASQVSVKKDWIGDASSAPQQTYQQPVQPQPVYQQTTYQPQPAPVARAAQPRGEFEYGFFDIIMGGGSRNIDISYENSGNGIYFNQIGFTASGISNGPYREVKIEDLEGIGMGPVGIRVGGFGKGAIGGDFEFSVSRHDVEPQSAAGTRNGLPTNFNLPTGGNYLTMTSFGFSGDLLIRVPTKKVDPYIGMGLGISLNRVQMPYVYGFTNSSVFSRPVDDFGVGLMLRVPVGMRIKFDPKFHLMAELRYELNTVFFDRGISAESDTITSSGMRFVMGIGFGL